MRYTIIIQSSANRSELSKTALKFAQSVLQRGHQIERVFFYSDGVDHANSYRHNPADEFDPPSQWSKFIENNQIDAVVCVATATRRGFFDAEQSNKMENVSDTIKPPFVVSGLGQLIAACVDSERCITFT